MATQPEGACALGNPLIPQLEKVDLSASSVTGTLSPDAIRGQLQRILNSKAFSRSPRISRFLTFVVEQTLDGQESKLKEYLLGVEVFGRLDSFDPRIDSIVRVEARRLRCKLDKYYDGEGANDQIHIQFRKGCYVPAFSGKREGDGRNGNLPEIPHVRLIENSHVFARYARGRACLAAATPESVTEAISCFSQAIEEDPECAPAHSGLASAELISGLLGLGSARDLVPRSRTSATRALAIVPGSSEALSVLGVISALYDRQWADGEAKLRRAIQSNPSDVGARIWYSLCLTLAGRSQSAIQEAKSAQQAAPTSLPAHLATGFACHCAGAYDEALQHYHLANEINRSCYGAYLALAMLFADQKMHEQALTAVARAAELQPRNVGVLAVTAYSHAMAQRLDCCHKVLAELGELARTQYVPPVAAALAYTACGDLTTAFRKLDEGYIERSLWLPVVGVAPAFEALRRDPRFENFFERIAPPRKAA